MTLHDLIVRFTATRSKADLAGVKRKYGEFGFFMACKAAGITRRVGRQILGSLSTTIGRINWPPG